tara:strand:- start:100 stop:303 length:204 start_codon:yes stop_codon:yes gene_type:complete
MIPAILIIITLVLINLILLVTIRWDQEYNWEDLHKRQHDITNDLLQIGRTVREIDRKIDLNEHLKKD